MRTNKRLKKYQLKIIKCDNRKLLKRLPKDSIDAMITDPPYELNFMDKSWDDMGISYNPKFWKRCLKVLKPGAYILVFGGSRTYHRIACAIEDAGFEIRDCLMWLYGSGFPKSHNVGKKLNKKKWQGWGTALKPAFEPIILARKPISEKNIVLNILKWGVGGINIDACRVNLAENENVKKLNARSGGKRGFSSQYVAGQNDGKLPSGCNLDKGRWPANILLNCCCDEIVKQNKIMIHTNSNCPCFILDRQSGKSKSTGVAGAGASGHIYGKYSGKHKNLKKQVGFGDIGGASRFFYCAKANKKERGSYNNHPTVKPLSLLKYLVKLITPLEGTIIDPFAGTFTTCIAAENHGFKWIACEQNKKSCKIGKRRIEEYFEHAFKQKIFKIH